LGVTNGGICSDLNSEKFGERQRIEGRALPSTIHGFESHRACARCDLDHRIVAG
jgi:hypothetical protein